MPPDDRVFNFSAVRQPIDDFIKHQVDKWGLCEDEEKELRANWVNCKTAGCACGELPEVFPDVFEFRPQYEVEVVHPGVYRNTTQITGWDLVYKDNPDRVWFYGVCQFFDIGDFYFNILFMPNCARDAINLAIDKLSEEQMPTFIEDVTEPEHVGWNIDVLIELDSFIKENWDAIQNILTDEYRVYDNGLVE